eukprot:7143592-Prymnesium_polylepis.1
MWAASGGGSLVGVWATESLGAPLPLSREALASSASSCRVGGGSAAGFGSLKAGRGSDCCSIIRRSAPEALLAARSKSGLELTCGVAPRRFPLSPQWSRVVRFLFL